MRQMFSLLLVLATVLSAIGVVYAKHQSRKLFVELQQLESRRDAMEVEWGQLQLEQSMLTTHGQIERVAHERMHMRIPGPQTTIILHP